MDIRQLRYFVGILEAKSLSKASTQLHVAQPALGVQIRNLERELGAKLLRRHARGVEPTEAGERLAQHADKLLRQFDLVRQDLIHYAAAPSGRVLLCVGRTMPRIVTATIAQHCRQKFPDIQLRILEGWQRLQLKMTTDTEPDLIITFRQNNDFKPVAQRVIQDELVYVYGANTEPSGPTIGFDRVTSASLILPSQGHLIRRIVEKAAELAGRDLKIYCDLESYETTKELVSRGEASTILPIACVREEIRDGKLRFARIKDEKLGRTLCILDSTRRTRSSSADLVHRLIKATILEFAEDHTFGWAAV